MVNDYMVININCSIFKEFIQYEFYERELKVSALKQMFKTD